MKQNQNIKPLHNSMSHNLISHWSSITRIFLFARLSDKRPAQRLVIFTMNLFLEWKIERNENDNYNRRNCGRSIRWCWRNWLVSWLLIGRPIRIYKLAFRENISVFEYTRPFWFEFLTPFVFNLFQVYSVRIS